MIMKKIFTILLSVLALSSIKAQFPNWTQLNYTYPNSTTSQDLRSVSVSPNDTIYAYNKSRTEPAHYSTDGGNTWNELVNTSILGRVLKLIPDNQGGVYRVKFRSGAFPDSVFYSNNLGSSWSYVSVSTTNPNGPIPPYNVNGLHFLHRVDSRGVIYLGEGVAGHNFKYSDDNGATWTTINCPHQPFSALVASDGTIYITTYNNGIYVSTDGGNTWDNSGYSGTTTCYDLFEDPTTGHIYHAWSYMAIRKSIDHGQTWTNEATYPANISKPIRQLLVTPDGMFYVRGDRDIYEASNNMSFTHILEQTDNLDFIQDIAASNQYLYAPVDGSIYKYARQTGTTSINDNKHNKLLNIFPNPANDVVTISGIAIGAKLTIRDISGKLAYHDLVNDMNYKLSTVSFKTGIYFIQVDHEGSVWNEKLIISKP